MTAIKMSSDKRLTEQLSSPRCCLERAGGCHSPGEKGHGGAASRWEAQECCQGGLLCQVLPLESRGAGEEQVERLEMWAARREQSEVTQGMREEGIEEMSEEQ